MSEGKFEQPDHYCEKCWYWAQAGVPLITVRVMDKDRKVTEMSWCLKCVSEGAQLNFTLARPK